MTQRILFIALSNIGDAVMCTAVLEALHGHFPEAGIDIVADQRASELFTLCPYRGEIIHKDKRAPLRGALDVLRRLRARRYDLIVDVRTDGLAYLIRAKRRLTKWCGRAYGPHAVEQLLGVIRKLHGDRALPATTLWLDAEHEARAEDLLRALPPGRRLAIGPACGGGVKKAWPESKYSTLANRLGDKFSAVILLGGPADAARSEAIGRGVSLPCIDTAGRTDLLLAAAVLKKAAFFLGSDSGLGHIAAAVNTPSLSLFSHADPARYAPWGKQAAWIKAADGDARSISVAEVESKIRALL